jgi:hypothetical protein
MVGVAADAGVGRRGTAEANIHPEIIAAKLHTLRSSIE